jgi:lysine-N-methylase
MLYAASCQERRLPQIKLIRPEYADKFRCIGPACEDDCCTNWCVLIDQATFAKYQSVPAGPLRSLIDQYVELIPKDSKVASPTALQTAIRSAYASIRMLPTGKCPFHTAERLCQIQLEQGESYLSRTCTTYPRKFHTIDDLEETALSLACPEAARLVLLDPHLMESAYTSVHQRTWDDTANLKAMPPLRNYFWVIRKFSIDLIRNRNYPLWQRLFLLGIFARRLDALARGELQRDFPTFFREFSAAIATGSLRTTMETIPADLKQQLDILLRMVNLRLGKNQLPPRLLETLQAFVQGIGHRPDASMESQISNYAQAWQRHGVPFFLQHPYFLENYLINYIFRNYYPLGASLYNLAVPSEFAREFSRLATHFALIKGLLIGVAGFYKEAFSTEHAVQTVQTAFRHFEHCPEFIDQAQELLVSRNMNNAHGLTMLLRN